VTQRDDYPVTVMTGHSIAEMIFQPDPINALGVEVPDIVILTAPEGLARNTARLAALPETTTVYTIPELLPLSTPARVVEIPTEALGLKRQRTQLVLGCAAYVALKTGLLTIDALLAAARKEGREEISSANVKTLEAIREKVLEE
jgi:Pyruvate/2-oxoacid:ferredoxin oxidoreductase gamma subunit